MVENTCGTLRWPEAMDQEVVGLLRRDDHQRLTFHLAPHNLPPISRFSPQSLFNHFTTFTTQFTTLTEINDIDYTSTIGQIYV